MVQVWKVDTKLTDSTPELVVEGLAKEVLFSMVSTSYKVQPPGKYCMYTAENIGGYLSRQVVFRFTYNP